MTATVTTLITLIAEFGFGAAIIQARELNRDILSSIFGAAVIFGLCSALTVYFLAPLAASFYNEEQLTPLLQMASLNFVILAFGTVPDGQLRRAHQFKLLGLTDFASILTGSISTFAFAVNNFGVWSLILGSLTSSLSRVMILQAFSSERVAPSLKVYRAIKLIHFGGQVAISRIAGYVVGHSDLLIAGRFLGKSALGNYYVALDLAMMPLNKIMSIANQAAVPILAQLHRESHNNQKDILIRALKLMAYVILPCLWGMASISQYLIQVVLGDQWSDAALAMQIICLALPFKAIIALISTAMISYGRADIEIKNNLINAAIFPVLFFIGTQYGLTGIAFSWCIALPIATTINIIIANKALELDYKEIASSLIKPINITAAMSLIVFITSTTFTKYGYNTLGLATLVVEGFVSYTILLFVFDRTALYDLIEIVNPHIKRPSH